MISTVNTLIRIFNKEYDIVKQNTTEQNKLLYDYVYFCVSNSNQQNYHEIHHIFPSYINHNYKNLKTNPFNAAYLSVRDHIRAHIMLYKVVNGLNESYTIRMMTQIKNIKNVLKLNDEEIQIIENAKLSAKLVVSEKMKGHKSYYDSAGNKYELKTNSEYTTNLIFKKELFSNNAKEYKITDKNGNTIYLGKCNIEIMCKKLDLPIKHIRQSLLRKGEPIDFYVNSAKPDPNFVGFRCFYTEVDLANHEKNYRKNVYEFIKWKLVDSEMNVVCTIYFSETLKDHNLPHFLLESVTRGPIKIDESYMNEQTILSRRKYLGYQLLTYTDNFKGTITEIYKPAKRKLNEIPSYTIYLDGVLKQKYTGLFFSRFLSEIPDVNRKNALRSINKKLIIPTKFGKLKVVKNEDSKLEDTYVEEIKVHKKPPIKTINHIEYLQINSKIRKIVFTSVSNKNKFYGLLNTKYPNFRNGWINGNDFVKMYKTKPIINQHIIYANNVTKYIFYCNIKLWCENNGFDKQYKSFKNESIISRGVYKGWQCVSRQIQKEI